MLSLLNSLQSTIVESVQHPSIVRDHRSPKFLSRANISQMPVRKLLALENMSSHATDSISSCISLVSVTSGSQLSMDINFSNTFLST